MAHAVVVAVVVLAVIHALNGLFSICLGVTSSIKAEVWLAHKVSPIWSGAFFVVTGLLGFACAKRKTAYMIMCFTAFSIVSLVTAVVSIQLLRLGLVNHTTDGNTFQKEKKDVSIIIALGCASFECVVCIVSSFVSCRMARAAKKELFQQRSELFHVQEEDSGADFTNIAQCANQNGAVMIPVDGGLHMGVAHNNMRNEVCQSNDYMEEVHTDRRQSYEAPGAIEIQQNQEQHQQPMESQSGARRGSRDERSDSVLVHAASPLSNYPQEETLAPPDMFVQDLESSKSDYNMRERLEVEVKLDGEPASIGYRPPISPILEEPETAREERRASMECLTQRDIDICLSPDGDSGQTPRAGVKPILKDKKTARDQPAGEEPAGDSEVHVQSDMVKRRIRFEDEAQQAGVNT